MDEVARMTSLLEEAVTRTNAVVLKRLKFIFKIIKSLAAQPNTRNRQAHVFVLEVLDAISDWSCDGKDNLAYRNKNTEIMDFLDNSIFPEICKLIGSLSKDEFNGFQNFFAKYLLVKWEERANFQVLEFLSEIYGFISRISPLPVVEECLQVFTAETMPPHITLIIVPAIIRNSPEAAVSQLPKTLSTMDDFDHRRQQEYNESLVHRVTQLWTSLKFAHYNTVNLLDLKPALYQCAMSSFHLDRLSELDFESILNLLIGWRTVNSESFLVISSIFLSSLCQSLQRKTGGVYSKIVELIHLVLLSINSCPNYQVRTFAIRVVQRLLEHNDELELTGFRETVKDLYNVDCDNSSDIVKQTNNRNFLDELEVCVKRTLSDSDISLSDSNKKRIRLLIDSLHNLC